MSTHTIGRPGRHRRRRTLGTLLSLLLAVSAGVVASSLVGRQAQAADVESHAPATYNMQGGSTVQDSKWTTDIQGLMRQHDILALQEAGPGPVGSAVPTTTHTIGQQTIRQFSWQVGSSTRGQLMTIYHMQTDQGGNRVNLAMVTRTPADEVYAVPPQATNRNARGAFGVRFGNTIFWTVHAQAAGTRNEANALLTAMADEAERTGRDWVAMGDFNRGPDTLDAEWRDGTRGYVYRSHRATQQAGGELDYMVGNRDVPYFGGRRLNGLSADHFPVDFLNLRAAAEINLSSVTDGGNFLSLLRTSEKPDGEFADLVPPTTAQPDTWSLEPAGEGRYKLLHLTKEGGAEDTQDRCLDSKFGEEETAGDDLVVNRCDPGSETQKWAVPLVSESENSTFVLRQGANCVSANQVNDGFDIVDCGTDLSGVTQWVWNVVTDANGAPIGG